MMGIYDALSQAQALTTAGPVLFSDETATIPVLEDPLEFISLDADTEITDNDFVSSVY